MTLLRTLGSRLRRDENAPENPRPSSSSSAGFGGGGPPAHTKPARALAAFAAAHAPADAPDLFYEDRELGAAVRALEDVRGVLHDVANTAEAHKEMLCKAAATQRELGEVLAGALEVGKGDGEGGDGFDDLDVGGNGVGEGGGEGLGVVAGFLSEDACESQRVLGQSFVTNSASMVKLGIAFCNPIGDLLGAFEERFARKIVPLRKRYVDQKGQYLKYMRQSDAAEEDEKRNYFDALAQAAKPVWVRTSKELKMEAHVMTQLTSRNLAKWSKGLALQHERGLAIAAANYADAFTRAKALSK